jgi:hypothetical protein
MSPLPILRLNTRIGASDALLRQPPPARDAAAFGQILVTRSHRWDVAAPSPEHASLSAVSRDERCHVPVGVMWR